MEGAQPLHLASLPPDVLKQAMGKLDATDLAALTCTSRALAGLASSEELWQGHASRWKHWAPGRYAGQTWRQMFIERCKVLSPRGPEAIQGFQVLAAAFGTPHHRQLPLRRRTPWRKR